MKRHFILSLVLLFAAVGNALADNIVARTQLKSANNMWRYEFHYTSVDVDGTTPIELSAAIFMSDDLHEKRKTAKGCILLNHYTMTSDAERPTNVTSSLTLESMFCTTNCFVIESDGIGFGLTKDRTQCYLQGRAAARCNIDAFIAGRKLLQEEGFDTGSAAINCGYSQGGHNGIWVDRLVAEGYRSSELSRINMSILGDGPYDIAGMYRQMVAGGKTNLPSALVLIPYEIDAYANFDFSISDAVVPELAKRLPALLDSKAYNPIVLNDSIYKIVGGNKTDGTDVTNLFTSEFLDETSDGMKPLMQWFKDNSLVYDSWAPTATDTIMLVHSDADEVVPYANAESLVAHLKAQGYKPFSLYTLNGYTHEAGGTMYVLAALTAIQKIKVSATGIQQVSTSDGTTATSRGTYTIGGQKVADDAPKAPGVYIVNGKKKVVMAK